MKIQQIEAVDEVVYSEVLPNGLTVFIIPKKGYSKTYATFTTKYGSIDRKFIPHRQARPITVPDGIAHFLEHKLFESEAGDVMDVFSEQSASVNAFTSATRTTYLFSATDQIDTNIETLLDFVQDPYFTEETVEKEKGIIAQEIQMYEDSADWRLYLGALEGLYEEHPVRIDIAGTIDSIEKITAEHLYTCYETFYHPSNMVFCVVGAVEPERVMEQIRRNQEEKTFDAATTIERFLPEEKEEAFIAYRAEKMDVMKPKVNIARKVIEVDVTGRDYLRLHLAMSIGLDTLFGTSSSFFEKQYENSVIDESFGYHFTLERSFGFVSISSDTYEEEAFIHAVEETLEELVIDPQEVERLIRRRTGQFIRALNSPEFIANQFTHYTFAKSNVFDTLEVLAELTTEDIKRALAYIQPKERQTIFAIHEEKDE